jgi:hypothetical protein
MSSIKSGILGANNFMFLTDFKEKCVSLFRRSTKDNF